MKNRIHFHLESNPYKTPPFLTGCYNICINSRLLWDSHTYSEVFNYLMKNNLKYINHKHGNDGIIYTEDVKLLILRQVPIRLILERIGEV